MPQLRGNEPILGLNMVIVILAKILDIRQLIAESMKGTNTQET
jgi:hypothetical protein